MSTAEDTFSDHRASNDMFTYQNGMLTAMFFSGSSVGYDGAGEIVILAMLTMASKARAEAKKGIKVHGHHALALARPLARRAAYQVVRSRLSSSRQSSGFETLPYISGDAGFDKK